MQGAPGSCVGLCRYVKHFVFLFADCVVHACLYMWYVWRAHQIWVFTPTQTTHNNDTLPHTLVLQLRVVVELVTMGHKTLEHL